jgi:MYXO-CTERM domain-containing protein
MRRAGRDEILATESITIDLHCGPIEEPTTDSSSDSSDSGGCSTTNTSPAPLALLAILPLLVLAYRRRP